LYFIGVFSFFEEAAVENKTHSFCFWMGSRAFLLTTEPSLIQKILLSNELWDKAETIYTPLYQAFRGGIIASGGDLTLKCLFVKFLCLLTVFRFS